jgi:hypothetical protein
MSNFLEIHLSRVKFPSKLVPCFPRQIFSDTTNIPDKMVTSNTRPTAATRASSEREQASKLLKASIDSFFLLSRNRTSLKSLKSYFHETRTVPCECREIVATIKQVKCCKGQTPKKHKALQSSPSPATVQTQISTIFVCKRIECRISTHCVPFSCRSDVDYFKEISTYFHAIAAGIELRSVIL